MVDCEVGKMRVAKLDDAHALASMHIASWHETYSGILPDKLLLSLSVEARTAAWARIMQEPASDYSTVVYIVEHEAWIIGFGSCGAQRTESLKASG
jgi:hypothetical protein